MLPKILVGSLAALVLLAGCKPSREQMLVGTWKVQGPNAAGVWTYRADHTLEFNGYDGLGRVSASGTWRVQGNKLTFNLGDSDRHAGVPDTTVTIVSLTSTQLQLQTVEETVVTLSRIK
jgi:uncharacterized protein (TIGR03066 family)